MHLGDREATTRPDDADHLVDRRINILDGGHPEGRDRGVERRVLERELHRIALNAAQPEATAHGLWHRRAWMRTGRAQRRAPSARRRPRGTEA